MPHLSPNSLLTPTASYIQAFKSFRRHLEHVYKRTIDPASRAEALTNLKSDTHRYHKLVIAAKQKYYSFTSALPTLDTSGAQSTLFFIANFPLHSLAPFHPPLWLKHSAHFLRQNIIPSLHTTVSSSFTADTHSSPIPPHSPSQSSLQNLYPASEAEVSLLLNSLPNKQCELDPGDRV